MPGKALAVASGQASGSEFFFIFSAQNKRTCTTGCLTMSLTIPYAKTKIVPCKSALRFLFSILQRTSTLEIKSTLVAVVVVVSLGISSLG